MCLNLRNMSENALFSGKIYTADKNFTRLPVATVATNFKSGRQLSKFRQKYKYRDKDKDNDKDNHRILRYTSYQNIAEYIRTLRSQIESQEG